MTQKRIVVVGCGVAGLTTALLLSKNADYQITVAAKHMPGDYDIEYASPWAGANYVPVSAANTPAATHDAETWPELERLAKHHPESGVHFQQAARYNRTVDVEKAVHNKDARAIQRLEAGNWFKDVVPNFRPLPPSSLPPGHSTGTTFTSVCIDTALYLPYLKSLCLAAGITFRRSIFSHIAHATTAHHSGLPAHVIVNCTGLSSRFLDGVNDLTLTPARGQTVLVRNEPDIMCDTSGTDDGEEEVCYVMQRAAGGGTLLGGCYQVGNWSGEVDLNLAVRIMRRAIAVCPSLVKGEKGAKEVGIEGLDVVRFGVGLRPVREGGVRLERERLGGGGGAEGTWVVHNYGHGGYGYQSSYGCAKVAVGLVEEVVGETAVKAKL